MRLNVWYEGAKIEVGKYYNPSDLIINLIHEDGRKEYLEWQSCLIDSYHVTKEGLNWFTLTYIISDVERLTHQFVVEGIVLKDYVDLEFKVLYVSDNEETDVTEDFKSYFELAEGNIGFTWTRFLDVVNLLKQHGKYILTIPKLSGLSNQYDMDWEVLCINETTLKANMKKIYKEEEDNG